MIKAVTRQWITKSSDFNNKINTFYGIIFFTLFFQDHIISWKKHNIVWRHFTLTSTFLISINTGCPTSILKWIPFMESSSSISSSTSSPEKTQHSLKTFYNNPWPHNYDVIICLSAELINFSTKNSIKATSAVCQGVAFWRHPRWKG